MLDKIGLMTERYLQAQIRAGAQAVQLFDSWAGLLEASDWEPHVRPHMEALLTELGRAGVPRVAFLNGAPRVNAAS